MFFTCSLEQIPDMLPQPQHAIKGSQYSFLRLKPHIRLAV